MSDPTEKSELETVRLELAEIKRTVDFQKDLLAIQKESQKDLASIRKDFSDLKTEVKVESNFYKWLGSTGVFVALILGAIGYSQWHDIITKLKSDVERTSQYQDNLARGLALANGNRPQDAIDYLRKCYEATPKDQAVAGNLLWSYEEDNDWEKASPVANALRKDFGIDKIQDPWVVNNVGRSLLYQGQSDSASLDEAGRYLKRAASDLKGDSDERDIWMNLWVYHLYRNELDEAEKSIETAVTVHSSKPHLGRAGWEELFNWSLFRYLEQKNKSMRSNAKLTIDKAIEP